ncbi:hypothetical protein PTSG_09402 [Salpingoeca rosetta]|uniref:VLRF1 domain-containing protein n=1 Tax=Salpingoeca rosetta (strain ATCC 50818 / BSB-021) TaxID=946362 RepID=F2UMI7_SALR5|nr:uncharacterized protein PTSG_09402 [Salpingoeca rosetta]EGD78336.1 hypothetical protein PTSG_09402 [Salpingoeca rosetta]|eukprot:XP_004989659.1 hypothetical protein PTSG_09402 [Salpingoeca rosetta]
MRRRASFIRALSGVRALWEGTATGSARLATKTPLLTYQQRRGQHHSSSTSKPQAATTNNRMATFFNKTTKDLLQHVRVQGVAPPQETADVATAYAERTLEEQTAMLQRQLERLKVQNRLRLAQQPGSQGAQQAANGDEDEGDDDVSSGENSEDDDELVRQESDHPPAPLDDDDDNDDNDNVGAETTAATGDGNLPVQKGPVLYFQAGKESANTWCSIYRDVLPSRGVDVGTHVVEEEIRSLPTAGPWAFFMLAGGHFAGAIVNRGQIQHHKCFHRYVVRAKRGTVQSVRDAKSGTSQPKSAGSNLRRYNEQQLRQDIEGLLREWKPYLASCTVIFHRTSVHNRSFIFQSAKQQKKTGTSDESDLLVRNDPRIRTVPFPTQRPTLKEIARVYALLTCINVLDGEPAFIRKHREQTEQSKTTGDAAQQQQHKEEQRKQREENDAEKKHAGAQQSAVVASTQTILYKACLKGDIGKPLT